MIVTWQVYYSAVKQFPPIFQFSGQWAMQFSDFFQLPEHICLEAMHALLFRHWTKIKILTSFHCRNFRQVTRDQKWTRSHNHRKILCYLEVTNTRFREPGCLRSSAAPQKHCSSCITWSSAATTPPSSINAVGNLILSANAGKCRAGVLSEHQPTALEIIKQVLYQTRIFFKQSFKINSLIKTCASVFLTELWCNKMVSIPQTSPTHTLPNDFPSRTDAASVLVLIDSCLHLGSINTQPFEGNGIGWFNYCNPITFTSFPHSNVSVMEVIRKVLIRLKYRPAMQ